MNWKHEAIDKLKQYEAKVLALSTIPEEIRRLELSMQSIRSTGTNTSPVKGGGNGREDMMLTNIVQRNELERSLEQARIWVTQVNAALEILSGEDRMILERFFIHREKGAADRLAGDLHVDVKTVYRWKDAALRKFTRSLYGVVES